MAKRPDFGLTNWPFGQNILATRPEFGRRVEAEMILDNFFEMLGGLGTSAFLVGVLALVGTPAMRAVACPHFQLRRIQRGL